MGIPGGLLPLNSHRASIQFLVSLLVILVVSSSLLLLSMLTGRLIFGSSVSGIDLSSEILEPSQRNYLKFIQTMSQVSIFLLPGLVISWFMTGNIPGWLGLDRPVRPALLAMVVLLALSCLPLTTITGILNSRMDLPGWMNFIEEWMRVKEDEAGLLTSHLVFASGTGGLIVNIIILALLPAAGEEILFRGVFQQLFQKWMKSGILAVLITAILFSTLHFQFYGFLPRLILGIVFGLLFLWSKSVWLPFAAHLVNNIIPVVLSYSSGWTDVNENIGDYVPAGTLSIVMIVVLPAALLFVIRDFSRQGSW